MPKRSQQTRTADAAPTRCVVVWVVTLLIAPSGNRVVAQVRPQSALTAHVTVASDSRHRGLSQLYDDSASLRLGLDLGLPSGLFVGASLGNVGFATEQGVPQPRERLVELYAGYVWQRPRWSITTLLGHYLYPGTTFDYDYSELTAVLSYRERFFYRLSYVPDYLSFDYSARNHELGIAWPLPWNIEVSASVGELDSGDFPAGYSYYDIGLTKLIGAFSVDVRRYDTSRTIVSPQGSSTADRWVVSLSYGINLRD